MGKHLRRTGRKHLENMTYQRNLKELIFSISEKRKVRVRHLSDCKKHLYWGYHFIFLHSNGGVEDGRKGNFNLPNKSK